MVANFDQTPDDIRSRADGKHRIVPGVLDHAEADPDYADRLRSGAGFGADAAVHAVRARREARRLGLTAFADRVQGAGDIGYRGAAHFEHTDTDGGAGIPRET
ncbi:hypothetical protein [Nocardia fusca]|uniref:hypothetical protein n=1 Tax=Nocardia fusca TaxID=941183 RepID=UPI0007A74D81|nr:hypothetical protein [Nocardia fusca]